MSTISPEAPNFGKFPQNFLRRGADDGLPKFREALKALTADLGMGQFVVEVCGQNRKISPVFG